MPNTFYDEYLKSTPQEWERILGKFPKKKQVRILWFVTRERCKKDLYYLITEILGYDRLKLSPIFKEICSEVQHRKAQSRLFLLPRGFYKTTIITISYNIFLILNKPDIGIAIVSQTIANARGFLRKIVQHFTTNEKFRYLFPEFCPKVNKKTNEVGEVKGNGRWTQDIMRVPNAGEGNSIEVASVDTVLTSRHFNHLCKDDLVDKTSVTTRDQIRKTTEWDEMSVCLWDNVKDGMEDIVGTRYHYDDLYGKILDREHVSVFDKFKDVMTGKSVDTDEGWTCPSIVDKKAYEKICEKMSPYNRACQYRNEPVDDENADFRQSWIDRCIYQRKDCPKEKELNIFITMDVAFSKSDTADYTAFVVCGIDVDGTIWVLDTKRARLDPNEIIKEIFQMHNRWKPIRMAMQKYAIEKILRFAFNKERARQGVYFSIYEVQNKKGKNPDDEDNKIRALVPFIANGEIRIREDMKDLIEEMIHYPRGHDDLIDALSDVLEIMRAPQKEKKKEDYAPYKKDGKVIYPYGYFLQPFQDKVRGRNKLGLMPIEEIRAG